SLPPSTLFPYTTLFRSKTLSLVHSTNDTSTTTFGFTHCNFIMSSAVTPSPQCPVLLLGRLTNGQRAIWSAAICRKISARLCGVRSEEHTSELQSRFDLV